MTTTTTGELHDMIDALTQQRDDLLAACEVVVRAKDLLVPSKYIDEFSDEAKALTKIYTMAKAAIAKCQKSSTSVAPKKSGINR